MAVASGGRRRSMAEEGGGECAEVELGEASTRVWLSEGRMKKMKYKEEGIIY